MDTTEIDELERVALARRRAPAPGDGGAALEEMIARLTKEAERFAPPVGPPGPSARRFVRLRFATLCGMMAALRGLGADEAAARLDEAELRCWRFGWDREKNVSRETARSDDAVGKGKARIGDRRTWPREDLDLLDYCVHDAAVVIRRAELAAMCGRSEDAVRAQITKVRKARRTNTT